MPVVLLILGVGFYFQPLSQGTSPFDIAPAPTGVPLSSPTQTPYPTTKSNQSSEEISTAEPEALPTSVLKDELPVFTITFIPLNWQGTRTEFEQAAQQHASEFVSLSGIDHYYKVEPLLAEDGLDGQDLTDTQLLNAIIAFAVENNLPGSRYIGLTDGDLAPDGMSDVLGWTTGGMGAQAVVAEEDDPYTTVHELGHTFGLCDEYSYAAWVEQNEEAPCPNPYPTSCPKDVQATISCDGDPATNGDNSIMGAAGIPGNYAFNAACLRHLTESFENLTSLQENLQ